MVFLSVSSFLWNIIPIIRNRIDWHEHMTAGLVSGTLAGYLFSDPKPLGLNIEKYKGRVSYRTRCILHGAVSGFLIGAGLTVYSFLGDTTDAAASLRNWELYWKQRKKVKCIE